MCATSAASTHQRTDGHAQPQCGAGTRRTRAAALAPRPRSRLRRAVHQWRPFQPRQRHARPGRRRRDLALDGRACERRRAPAGRRGRGFGCRLGWGFRRCHGRRCRRPPDARRSVSRKSVRRRSVCRTAVSRTADGRPPGRGRVCRRARPVRGREGAAAAAQRPVDALRKPYAIAGATVHSTASVGVAMGHRDAPDADAVLHAGCQPGHARGQARGQAQRRRSILRLRADDEGIRNRRRKGPHRAAGRPGAASRLPPAGRLAARARRTRRS